MEINDEVEATMPLFFYSQKILWVFIFLTVIYNIDINANETMEEKTVQDSELIRLLREKKPEGIDALSKKYGPLIKYIIEPILSDYREREECLSDVTYRIWDKIDYYEESKGNFNTWISTITRNMAYNRANSNKVKGDLQEIPEQMPSKDRSPEEEILRKEKIERLHSALNKLSKKDREIVFRKYFYMQSTEQIAAELGLRVRGVEGKLYRIKKRLRGEFDE